MPRATVSTDTQRYDLKTLPEGFVELKRMSYGAWLHRQEMSMRLKIEAERNKAVAGEMAMANKAVTQYEFQQCIVNHNLEDENGQELDFRSIQTLEKLDPRVGNEIGQLINDMHEFNEEELGNA